MKVTMEFNLDDPHETELCNRYHMADKMAGLLEDIWT